MKETYDIVSDDGGRIVRCVHDGETVTIEGKEGATSLMDFLSQVVDPSVAKRKLCRQHKNKQP